MWALEIQAQVFILAKHELHPPSHLPSLHLALSWGFRGLNSDHHLVHSVLCQLSCPHSPFQTSLMCLLLPAFFSWSVMWLHFSQHICRAQLWFFFSKPFSFIQGDQSPSTLSSRASSYFRALFCFIMALWPFKFPTLCRK